MDNLIPDKAKDILNYGDEFSGLAEILPWVKTGSAAYKFLKRKRIENFFKSLEDIRSNLNQSDSQRLKTYLATETGFDLLGEYIDKVHQTSSTIVSCALALLLVSESVDKYSKDFKLAAVNGLIGMDDETIKAFLELTKPDFLARRFCDNDGPYPVYIVDIETADGETDPKKFSAHTEMLISYVHLLTIRGLLLPDYSTGRYGGGATKLQPYGVGIRTTEYRKLLIEAIDLMSSDRS
jgi:hypothetical protein